MAEIMPAGWLHVRFARQLRAAKKVSSHVFCRNVSEKGYSCHLLHGYTLSKVDITEITIVEMHLLPRLDYCFLAPHHLAPPPPAPPRLAEQQVSDPYYPLCEQEYLVQIVWIAGGSS